MPALASLASGKIYLLDRVNGSVTVLNNNAPHFFGLAEVTPEPGRFCLIIGDALLAAGLRLHGKYDKPCAVALGADSGL